MDIRCPICAEPWENDTLHDYAEEVGSTYREVGRLFRTKGCGVAFAEWGVTCEPASQQYRTFAGVLFDLNGDDLDGACADMEDLWPLQEGLEV